MIRIKPEYACYMKNIAIRQCGSREKYYEIVKNLISDIQFFNMFMEREKKSPCGLTVSVRIPEFGNFSMFEDRRKAWPSNNDEDILESIFVECLCIEKLMMDLRDREYDSNTLTHEEEIMLVTYFEDTQELCLTDYVNYYIYDTETYFYVVNRIKELREECSEEKK